MYVDEFGGIVIWYLSICTHIINKYIISLVFKFILIVDWLHYHFFQEILTKRSIYVARFFCYCYCLLLSKKSDFLISEFPDLFFQKKSKRVNSATQLSWIENWEHRLSSSESAFSQRHRPHSNVLLFCRLILHNVFFFKRNFISL